MEQTLANPPESRPQMAPPNKRRRKLLWYVAGGVVALVLILGAWAFLFSPLSRVSWFDVPWAGSLAWSPDGSLLAVAGKSLSVYDITTGDKLLDYALDSMRPVAWSPDGSKLAAGINRGEIAIWDVSSVRTTRQLIPLQQFKAYAHEVFDLQWSPDGTLLASIDGEEDDTVILWDAATGEPVWKYKEDYLGFGLAWSPDGSILAAKAVNAISLLDVRQRDWAATLPHTAWPNEYGIEDVDWSPDGQQLVFGYSQIYNTGGMGVVDVASGNVVTSFSTQQMVEKVDWSPTRNLIALGSNDYFLNHGVLYLYNTKTKEQRWVPLATDPIEDLAWSPDGTLLAVSSAYQGQVTLWRLTSWAGGDIVR